ncbi:Maf family protein [Patescibacteria group bacterium]|nr:Maf family protein [Patescibacteria group bacterium]
MVIESETFVPPMNPDKEARINAELDKYFKTNTVLASSSDFRFDALQSVGFRDVASTPMDNDAEKALVLRLLEDRKYNFRVSGSSLEQISLAEDVARGKVEHILESSPNLSDSIVVAADTVVESATPVINPSSGDFIGTKVEYLLKPADVEEVKINLISLFENIVASFRFLSNDLVESYKSGEEVENNDAIQHNFKLTNDAVLWTYLRVNTGIAMKFPGEPTIQTINSSIYLLSKKLADIASSKNDQDVEAVVDELLEMMKQKNIDPQNIAGGLDYSDPDIRCILDIEEVGYIKPEAGIYSGLPKDALQKYLQDKVAGQV